MDEYEATGAFTGAELDAVTDEEAAAAVRFALTAAKTTVGYSDTDAVSVEVVIKRVDPDPPTGEPA